MTGYQSKRAAALNKLAQPAQEPVAWAVYDKRGGSKGLHWHEDHSPDGDATKYEAVPRYTAPPKRPWVGLTNVDTFQIAERLGLARVAWIDLMKAIEAKLKEKNT
jgi:hypothetical protein